MKLAIIIPAYNEEQTIGQVIAAIPSKMPQISVTRIFLVDNGSTDKTSQTAQKIASERGWNMEVVNLPEPCLAKAFITGVEDALIWDADYIVNLDADGQYDPGEIPLLLAPLIQGQADLVIGDRMVKTLKHMPPGKKYGNLAGSWFIKKLTRMASPTLDASSGFRAFTAKAAEQYKITSTHTYTHENLIQAHYLGQRILQIPITFRPRPAQAKSRLISSLPAHITKSLKQILKAWWVNRKAV